MISGLDTASRGLVGEALRTNRRERLRSTWCDAAWRGGGSLAMSARHVASASASPIGSSTRVGDARRPRDGRVGAAHSHARIGCENHLAPDEVAVADDSFTVHAACETRIGMRASLDGALEPAAAASTAELALLRRAADLAVSQDEDRRAADRYAQHLRARNPEHPSIRAL